MVTFPMTLMDPNPVFKVTTFLKSNIGKMAHLKRQSYYCTKGKIPNIWNGTMFGDLN